MQKYALVTGASSGIGEAIAKALAQDGYYVMLVGRRQEELERVLAQIGGPEKGENIIAELTDPAQTATLASRVRARTDQLHVAVQSAGQFKWDSGAKGFPGGAAESIPALRAVNATSKQQLWGAIGDLLRAAHGVMVVVSSQAANFEETDPRRVNELGYVTSMQETSAWAKQLQASEPNVRIELVEPGLVDTPLARENFTNATIGHDVDWDHDPSVLKPEQLAAAVLDRIHGYSRGYSHD